jgi:hypothetical protein
MTDDTQKLIRSCVCFRALAKTSGIAADFLRGFDSGPRRMAEDAAHLILMNPGPASTTARLESVLSGWRRLDQRAGEDDADARRRGTAQAT